MIRETPTSFTAPLFSMNKIVPNVKEKIVELATGRKAAEEEEAAAAAAAGGGAGGAGGSGGGGGKGGKGGAGDASVPKITGTDGQEILVAAPPQRQKGDHAAGKRQPNSSLGRFPSSDIEFRFTIK